MRFYSCIKILTKKKKKTSITHKIHDIKINLTEYKLNLNEIIITYLTLHREKSL
jgi:hypothetical protein